MKRLKRILLVLVLLAAALSVFVGWSIRRSWPQVEGTVEALGLSSPVEVIRDRWGTPHLYAEGLEDLLFAQGYVQAQDRMWQMEFHRRAGSGTLAAVVGPEGLRHDRAVRTIGLRRAAELEWSLMEAPERRMVEAFARGVNTYLRDHKGRLAVEFRILGVDPEPWEPVDSLLTVKLMYWLLSENAGFEYARARYLSRVDEAVIAEILPPYSEGAPVIVPSGSPGFHLFEADDRDHLAELSRTLGTPGPGQGSNGWVLEGERTASGKPLLANDTHLDLFMPSSWYATGLHGGGLEVVGYSLAGTPLIVIGHNRSIAWGLTDLVPDVEDLYLEKLDDPENPQKYLFQGEWRDLEIVEESIEVRGAEAVPFRLISTHHGNLVNSLGGSIAKAEPMSLAWPGHQGKSMIAAIATINRAQNWKEFRQGAALWDGPHVSLLYADPEGNIGFQAAGRIPHRVPEHRGSVPVPGWTGDYDWLGNVPFEAMPYAYNPEQGYVVAANQKAVADDYPYQLGYEWADPFRAMRITERLLEIDQASAKDMAELQGDTLHLPARALRPFLLAIEPQNDLERRALAQLEAWNLRMDPEEIGPSLYQVWYRFLVRNLLRDELGEELAEEYVEYYWVHGPVIVRTMEEGTSELFDDISTVQIETREEISRRSFEEAMEWLSSRLGNDPDDWRWARLHESTFYHRPIGMAGIPILSRLFNGGPFPSPAGDRFTVNAGWFSVFDPEQPYGNDGGAALRMVLDLSDWDRALAVNSTGQSEHLFHPHREDLLELWRTNRLHPLPFSRQAVESAQESILRLEPMSDPNHD